MESRDLINDRTFFPAVGLSSAHLQTVWGRLTRSRRVVSFRRESLETPDGDELLLDHAGAIEGAPRALLLHGLEGSSNSVYIQGLTSLLLARGLNVTVFNFRSCARDPLDLTRMLPNRRPRLYHSGETEDLQHVVETLRAREPRGVLVAAGVSLGGNALLKWLGERGASAPLTAAATMSVPYDLAAGAEFLKTRIGRLYVRRFVETLVPKARRLLEAHPEVRGKIDLPRAARATTFFEFDDAATAPLHGFAGADDYYARSSSISFVSRIAVPTLALSAEDDPFLPPEVLPLVAAAAGSSAFTLVVTRKGGHAGFLAGRPFRPHAWGEAYLARWLAERAGRG